MYFAVFPILKLVQQFFLNMQSTQTVTAADNDDENDGHDNDGGKKKEKNAVHVK